MPVFRDRTRDTSTSTGVGNFTLSGTAPTAYQSFATAFGGGGYPTAPFLYCIEDLTSGLWEDGTGYLTNATTLVRDAMVMDGSSGPGVLVAFTAGTKNVFCTITAHWCEDVDTGSVLSREKGWAMP
jgi:hypothetical protein